MRLLPGFSSVSYNLPSHNTLPYGGPACRVTVSASAAPGVAQELAQGPPAPVPPPSFLASHQEGPHLPAPRHLPAQEGCRHGRHAERELSRRAQRLVNC